MKNVVLLHGWGMNQGIWQLQKNALSELTHHQVLTFDLPGFGDAAFVGEKYTLEAVTQQLSEQIPDNSVLVAWSLSGLVAINMAKQFPHKVSKIILVASTPFFAQSNDWPGIELNVLEMFMAQLVKNHGKTVERFLAIQAMGSEHAKQDIKVIKQLLNEFPEASELALAGGLEILKNDDLRADFSALTVPLTGIFGRLDSLVPCKAVSEMQSLNGQFKVDIINKASHAPFISHPDEFTNLLLSHIDL